MLPDVRPQMPDALRVLVEEFPRTGWDRPSRFQALIQFWLQKHMAFRHLLRTLQTDCQGVLNGANPDKFKRALQHDAPALINELHGHHVIEDVSYFPVLAKADPIFAKGLKILDKDHHALDGQLHSIAKAANAALHGPKTRGDVRTAAGCLEALFSGISPHLERHFIDEEELVVPVLLKHEPAALAY